MNKKIIITGPAAAGKDFLKKRLGENGFKLDVSYTSREPREGEVEGEDYNFITKKDFELKIKNGGFYEWVKHGDYYYGTGMFEWKNCDVFIMETDGIEQISPDERKRCLVIYLNIPRKIRFDRLWKDVSNGGREWEYTKIVERFEQDDKKFENFKNYDINIENPYF